MKKIDFIVVVLILYIGAISGIQFLSLNSLRYNILHKLDMQYKEIINTETQIKVQNNLHNIEENISKLDSKFNTGIDELLIKSQDQSISLNSLSKDIRSKKFPEVKELKDLLFVYIDNVEKYIANEKQVALIETVEADFLIQILLDQGFSRYSNKDFTEALKIYKEVLDLDSKNKKALCYFSASLYYQNPGDSTHYSVIKNKLTPLLEADVLTEEEKSTVLNILKGISLEEGSM